MSQTRLVTSGLIPLPSGANSRPSRRYRHCINAVLVPADVKGQQRKESRTLQQSQSRGLAGALLSAFKALEREKTRNMQLEIAPKGTTERVNEAIKSESRSKKAVQPLPQIDEYLRSVGIMELRYIRMLSNLCSLTYHMDKLSSSSMMRRHNLRLITSSLACNISPRLAQVSAFMAVVDGDAMAADINSVMASQRAEAESAANAEPSPAMIALSKVEALTPASIAAVSVAPLTTTKSSVPQTAGTPVAVITTEASTRSAPATTTSSASMNLNTSSTPAIDVVAQSLAAAAAAASSAADTVVSAAAPIAAPIASNISAFTSSASVRSVASQLQSAASLGQSTAMATFATVTAAVAANTTSTANNNIPDPTTTSSSAAAATKDCSSPTEWFVVDDTDSKTRYIVIQGSDNVDHWRVNLTFDPVTFEDASLGIKVHRGVYEAAKQLYDRFLPMVLDHMSSSPTARIALTGHSLGGSLATVLMMMLVHRGVIDSSNLLPVYTFGAPAIFCQGGACCSPSNCSLSSKHISTDDVLSRLGLPDTSVRNVIMHKDIVPRAFACDYSPVADILKRVSESFKEHRCLSGNRRVMFHFVGTMMVLQPSDDLTFVQSDGYHAMLPAQPGLFVLRDTAAAEQDRRSTRNVSNASPHAVHAMATAKRNITDASANVIAAPGAVQSSKEAVWHLMNNPHPLTTLSDPGAYGDAGSISRYHNPDNYTRALGGVLRSRGEKGQNLVKNAKQAGVAYKPVLRQTVGREAGGDQHTEEKKVQEGDPVVVTRGGSGGKMQLPPLHRRI